VEEIDDSSGSFAVLVEGLFLAWIKARKRASADPLELNLLFRKDSFQPGPDISGLLYS